MRRLGRPRRESLLRFEQPGLDFGRDDVSPTAALLDELLDILEGFPRSRRVVDAIQLDVTQSLVDLLNVFARQILVLRDRRQLDLRLGIYFDSLLCGRLTRLGRGDN